MLFDEISSGIFSELEYLKIKSCDSLRALFSSAVFRGLINIRELIVENCEMLENIVEIKEGEDIVKLFPEVLSIPKLQVLRLLYLPKIRYFARFAML